MLAQLGHLDPCEGPEGAAIRRERDPGGLGIGVTAEPPKQPRPLGEHPRLGPWRVSTTRFDRVPSPGRWVPARVTAEVRPPARRPPDVVIRPGFPRREPRPLRSRLLV